MNDKVRLCDLTIPIYYYLFIYIFSSIYIVCFAYVAKTTFQHRPTIYILFIFAIYDVDSVVFFLVLICDRKMWLSLGFSSQIYQKAVPWLYSIDIYDYQF